VKKERSDILHRLSEEKKRLFYLRNSGTEARVLFESDNSNGFMHGFTENYVRVRTEYNAALVNQVVDVRLEELSEGEFHIKFG
jgi:threonylcarbamoyladenosine tRNA methylthiotransferase MtaB